MAFEIPIEVAKSFLGNYVLLSTEMQYRFLRRDAKLGISFYTQNPAAKYVYLHPNSITKVIVSFGVYNDGKQDFDIHIIEFTEGNGRVTTFAIDDKGLEMLGGKNPNSGGGDVVVDPGIR